MLGEPIVFNNLQREKVEAVCRQHAAIRQWCILAINVRSNHVHVVVSARSDKPQAVRDQFKANATRVLRQEPDAICADKVWTRGGDCELIDNEDDLQQVLLLRAGRAGIEPAKPYTPSRQSSKCT